MRLRVILALPLLACLPRAVGAQDVPQAPSPAAAPLCLEKAEPLSASTQKGSSAPQGGIAAALGFPTRYCGACSDNPCRGAVWFSQCGYGSNGMAVFCYDNGTCPVDGKYFCHCGPPQ